MPKFREKSTEGTTIIEAVQLTWDNWNEICEFVSASKLVNGKPELKTGPNNSFSLSVPTIEGVKHIEGGYWIAKQDGGGLCMLKPDIFAATYEAVD